MEWFEAACSERWVGNKLEKTRLELHLPSVKAEVFRVYREWIYSGNICFSRCTKASEIKDKVAEHTLLIDLYLLGFAVADLQLRNVAIREMSKSLGICYRMPDQHQIAVVWAATGDGDCLRRLLLNFVITKGDQE